ncbi:MAG TPA: hypothetical protein VIG41_13445 [Micrococcaceae bacterium]
MSAWLWVAAFLVIFAALVWWVVRSTRPPGMRSAAYVRPRVVQPRAQLPSTLTNIARDGSGQRKGRCPVCGSENGQ